MLDDNVTLHDIVNNNSIRTKHRDVQPVLLDDVTVNSMTKTRTLKELKRVTTSSQGKDLVYIGEGQNLASGGFVLDFYDTLMKPGTYVQFILKETTANTTGFSAQEILRNEFVDTTEFESDLDGEVWVGTDRGLGVFYSPELIFSNQNFYGPPRDF